MLKNPLFLYFVRLVALYSIGPLTFAVYYGKASALGWSPVASFFTGLQFALLTSYAVLLLFVLPAILLARAVTSSARSLRASWSERKRPCLQAPSLPVRISGS